VNHICKYFNEQGACVLEIQTYTCTGEVAKRDISPISINQFLVINI